MEFTPRIRQILLALLTRQEVIPIKNLAKDINISKRTVQRELDYINYILKKYNLSLNSKTGAGIWLEGEESQKQLLLEELENKDDKDFADKAERRKNLMLELLRDQTPKKLYYYANLFSVSDATISKDMEQIEPWFQKYDLQILRKQGYGVTLQGSEKNFRIAIREFISKYINTPMLNQLYESNDSLTSNVVGIKKIKNKYQLLNEDILKRVGICLSSIPHERIKRLTEEASVSLILHVTIAIERLQAGEIIESNTELIEKLKQDNDYELALQIVNSLEHEFSIEIPDIEVAYICLHIKGAKLQNATDYKKDEISSEQQEELIDLVRGMIVAYDEQIAHILESDDEFVNGLATHMRPTIVRLRNQMPIENPHIEEIKHSYTDIYERCQKVGKYLEDTLGFLVPESEIGYLAIHFGAALVRLESEKEKRRTVNIGLVCASGIGISRLMASRLKNFLKDRVNITTYGKADLSPFVLERNDFFVSSMYLGDIEIAVLQVSPLLPEKDLVRIEEKVKQYEITPKKREENLDFVRQMEKINELANRIKEILRGFLCIQVDYNADFKKLLELAVPKITPYEENQLRIIEEINKREKIATQIFPELGIGLLHSKIQGVFQAGFYVCIPNKQKKFVNPYMQASEAVVIMLMPDDEHKQENSQLFGYLSESLIEDETFLEDIKSGDEIQIKDTLSRLLKQYFNKYLDVV